MVGLTSVPLRGDAVWIDFNPQAGHEQAGRRPAMVKKIPKLLKKHDKVFQVEWKDGHVSWYPYTYLRQMCPCAECSIIRHKGRDVHSLFAPQGDGDVTLIEVSDDIQPLDVQLVGRYALQFSWNDGHDTGIYPFEVLRETCPCPECAPLHEKSPIQTEENN